jgi:hypothetical protein
MSNVNFKDKVICKYSFSNQLFDHVYDRLLYFSNCVSLCLNNFDKYVIFKCLSFLF